MKKVIADNGKIYRITSSTIPAGDNSIRRAFNKLGIIDQVNALPPRHSVRHEQLNIWADGRVTIADSRINQHACHLARTI